MTEGSPTAVGTGCDASAMPRPSCPWLLFPQQYRAPVPSASTAHVCWAPADAMLTLVRLALVPSAPSWPNVLSPQQNNSAAALTAQM